MDCNIVYSGQTHRNILHENGNMQTVHKESKASVGTSSRVNQPGFRNLEIFKQPI